jgi:putative phage DNA polymerase
MNLEKVVIYDIEIFKHDFLLVFKDINKNEVATFHNGVATENFNPFICDSLGIKITEEDGKYTVNLKDIVNTQVLVGYNNYYYDDRVIQELMGMLEKDIEYIKNRLKQVNDMIIGNRFTTRFRNEFTSLDVFQQIDVGRPSLKMIEANKGVSIEETTVPFNIDRPLTVEELEATVYYCNYDVDQTIDIYKDRIHTYFVPKVTLVKRVIKEQKDFSRYLRFNTTTLVGNLFKQDDYGETELVGSHVYDVVPKEVKKAWLNFKDNLFINTNKNNEAHIVGEHKNISVRELDCDIEFGYGGLHGVPVENKGNIIVTNDVKLLDVASLYPTIIGNLKLLGIYTDDYIQMKYDRLKVKHTDKPLSDSLKLILNSTYGVMNSKFSPINNPVGAYSVCFYGQSLLYDLSKELYNVGCKLININTDGVAFTTDNEDYKNVWKKIEEKYDITLEEDKFVKWIQKDVNNYIAVTEKGKVKVKGGAFSKYQKTASHNYKNYSNAIVDKAIVEYLTNGTAPLTTVLNHREDKELFQIILKCGGTYLGTVDEDKNLLSTKVNRVFACKKTNPKRTKLYKAKEKEDGSLALANFPDVPDDMIVFNGNVKDLDSNEIDLSFYLGLINSKLKDLGQIVEVM